MNCILKKWWKKLNFNKIINIFPSLRHFSLACRCENLARSRNYTMFGLQYYGECWAGTGSCDTFERFGRSQLCYGQKYKNCDNDDANECVGGPHANYVYLITE